MLSQGIFSYILLVSAFLFTLGALGVLIRRNPLVVFMCIELMLNSVNLALVAYSRYLDSEEGQIFAFMVIVVAAAEVVVGLALLTRVFRSGRELDVDDLDEMKQCPHRRRLSSAPSYCSCRSPAAPPAASSACRWDGASSTSPAPSPSAPPSL